MKCPKRPCVNEILPSLMFHNHHPKNGWLSPFRVQSNNFSTGLHRSLNMRPGWRDMFTLPPWEKKLWAHDRHEVAFNFNWKYMCYGTALQLRRFIEVEGDKPHGQHEFLRRVAEVPIGVIVDAIDQSIKEHVYNKTGDA